MTLISGVLLEAHVAFPICWQFSGVVGIFSRNPVEEDCGPLAFFSECDNAIFLLLSLSFFSSFLVDVGTAVAVPRRCDEQDSRAMRWTDS